jgi:ATP-dependent helicase Lhr and Lhr-like helicase
LHKGDLRAASGEAIDPDVRAALEDPARQVVAAVINTIDDALDRSEPGTVVWDTHTVPALRDLFTAAQDRVVIMVSDHGHVVDRGPEAVTRRSDASENRWRPATQPAGEGEVAVSGSRVALGGGTVVLPWREEIRYGPRKAGYHGGASPAEAVIRGARRPAARPDRRRKDRGGVDEVHAFAGDDRGWHLLAVLERLAHLIGHPLQRIGLSATVGNPNHLLAWLRGAAVDTRPAVIVAPDLPVIATADAPRVPPGEVELDYVGSLPNAAKIIAALYAGEKRLVFCEARQTVEELRQLLRGHGITTFLSHASLSADERRRSEAAFAEARDCVIVSTSTLELGIDVGDLDRVIQIDVPGSVASFLQRLGRTGRRAGSTRNCLFLATSGDALMRAAALLLLWGRGWVEPVAPTPEPRHIVAQQLMALCLQEHRVGDRLWSQWWNGLPPFDRSAEPIARHLAGQGYLDKDGGMFFIGQEAEKRFGRRHFMDMTAVFLGPPEFTVMLGRDELGKIDPCLLTEEVPGPRRLLLCGRSWQVTYIDWKRRRCFVEPADSGGKARWTTGGGVVGTSFALTRAARNVLLGADPPVKMTRRAVDQIGAQRDKHSSVVHPGGAVILRADNHDLRWWTWAGFRANATLAATLSEVVDPTQRYDDRYIRLREDLTPAAWRELTADASTRLCLPEVSRKALDGLKFSAALPERLAMATLAARLADLTGAEQILAEPSRFVVAA